MVEAYNPDGLTVDEYFDPDSTTKKDIGRPMVVKEKRQTFKGSAWITEDCPISLVDELIPILDILCNFNDIPWFDSLRQMLKLIPKGFPVRLDIPLFYVLTARVTFQNINAPDAQYCTKDSSGRMIIDPSAFEVPSDYSVTRENLADTIETKRKENNYADPEMEEAINQSLKELGWAQTPEARQAILESQRQVQHQMNLRMDEEAALQEAIKRSLN